jgi:hypothetical protein
VAAVVDVVPATIEINQRLADLRVEHVTAAVHNQLEMHSLIQLQVGKDLLKPVPQEAQAAVAELELLQLVQTEVQVLHLLAELSLELMAVVAVVGLVAQQVVPAVEARLFQEVTPKQVTIELPDQMELPIPVAVAVPLEMEAQASLN